MASFVPDYSPISMTNPESMRMQVAQMLKGIDRYNPENLIKLENYVQIQATENMYDLEANLAVLKLYQFNPSNFKHDVVATILLKALTNLPHTDFVLCKCLIDQDRLSDPNITLALKLHYLLEMCEFQQFWVSYIHFPLVISVSCVVLPQCVARHLTRSVGSSLHVECDGTFLHSCEFLCKMFL
ncbi:unnamed protein product [Ixodes persulcatus]